MPEFIIYLKNITVNFNGFKALNKVDFAVGKGELRMLIGPNGAGKTTLIDVISGRIKPQAGKVYFKGENIYGFPEYRIAQLGISRKFQTPTVFNNLSVLENMEISLNKAKGVFSNFKFGKLKSDLDKIISVLQTIGLEGKAGQRAGILAHGEKQWLELGMNIVQEPVLLLVDEPVAGMTGKERDKTGELLQLISRDRSVVVVEHDMEFVRKIAKKVTVLHEGAILCEGTMAEIQANPVVLKVYLGRAEEG
jgi:urea transport system ATP-binding protein